MNNLLIYAPITISFLALIITAFNSFITFKNSNTNLDVIIESKLLKTDYIYTLENDRIITNNSNYKCICCKFDLLNSSNKDIGIYNLRLKVSNKKPSQLIRYQDKDVKVITFKDNILSLNNTFSFLDGDNNLKDNFICKPNSFNSISTAITLPEDTTSESYIDLENEIIELSFTVAKKNILSYFPIIYKFSKPIVFNHKFKPDEIAYIFSNDIKLKKPFYKSI